MYLFITGANRGLGYELTIEALKRGHSVLAGTRNPEAFGSKLFEAANRFPDKLQLIKADVQDENTIADAAAKLKVEGVVLHSIINNAAILNARDTRIEELDMEDVEKAFDVNLFGPMRVVKHLLPLLSTGPGSSIINISSEAGSLTHAYPNDYPYGISKTALNMFTRQLNSLLKDRDVLVLSVHPGWMRTDMGGEQAAMDPGDSARGIIDLIERKVEPQSSYQFVKFNGEEMPI